MGRTFTSLTYHLVFSTKYRQKTIRPEFEDDLFHYIGGIIRNKNGLLLEINGTEDHLHVLAGIASTIAVSDMLRFIKSNSSTWINSLMSKSNQKFHWQPGFGAFTVSHSQTPIVKAYIQKQKQHHQTKSFEDEFLAMLTAHQIAYDRKFVFEHEHFG